MAAPSGARIGVVGLAVMGQAHRAERCIAASSACLLMRDALLLPQNLALNIAEKGFKVALYNRTASKTDATLERARKEGTARNDASRSL
jgi:6-phosphogluconate dehydrogenase